MNKIIHKMNKNIFGKGKEKILECFYKNRNKEIYFSEILRQTGLTPNTTLKHLKNLQETGLILSIKKIGNTFYKINSNNPQIYSIFSFFDYKKLNALPSERKRAIVKFLKEIKIKPLICLIFGSTSKGTFSKKSDIDILLVYDKKEVQNKKLKEDIEAITGVKLQTLVIDLDYFKEQVLRQKDKVISHAIKTGFIITGFNYFYQEVLNE